MSSNGDDNGSERSSQDLKIEGMQLHIQRLECELERANHDLTAANRELVSAIRVGGICQDLYSIALEEMVALDARLRAVTETAKLEGQARQAAEEECFNCKQQLKLHKTSPLTRFDDSQEQLALGKMEIAALETELRAMKEFVGLETDLAWEEERQTHQNEINRLTEEMAALEADKQQIQAITDTLAGMLSQSWQDTQTQGIALAILQHQLELMETLFHALLVAFGMRSGGEMLMNSEGLWLQLQPTRHSDRLVELVGLMRQALAESNDSGSGGALQLLRMTMVPSMNVMEALALEEEQARRETRQHKLLGWTG